MIDSVNYHFVDTNILVYAHDISSGEKHRRALDLIKNLWETEHGCVSIQVLQEFYVTVTRKVASPISADQAAQIMRSFRVWRVHSPTIGDLEKAIGIQSRYLISFWDALIIQSAIQLQCRVLLSEDLNSQQLYDGVKVINPFV